MPRAVHPSDSEVNLARSCVSGGAHDDCCAKFDPHASLHESGNKIPCTFQVRVLRLPTLSLFDRYVATGP
jgi:hypothetical protein